MEQTSYCGGKKNRIQAPSWEIDYYSSRGKHLHCYLPKGGHTHHFPFVDCTGRGAMKGREASESKTNLLSLKCILWARSTDSHLRWEG